MVSVPTDEQPERRNFQRLRTRLTTVMTYVDTGKVSRSLTKNIGGKGICLSTEDTIAEGTKLELEITLPDRTQPITCSARVAWSRPMRAKQKSYELPEAETGVEFTKIDPKDWSEILQYAALNSLPPESPEP